MKRIRAIDWMRGLVMMLMTIDHAGDAFDAHHFFTDGVFFWKPGTPIPTGEFLTRWLTHLCAPSFVLLAGVSVALSSEKRRDQPGQTAFLVKRGLLIAALDPIWMSLAFTQYHPIILQVLYAIGMSLVCMAFLRRLPTRVLLGLALAIQAFGELAVRVRFAWHPLDVLWSLLLVGGPVAPRTMCAYPLLPWLSIMMGGFVLGRWLLETRERDGRSRVAPMLGIGFALLALFAVVRAIDGYGNWLLHRDSTAVLQWLHVAKYPPSIAYSSLELGICFCLLALFFALDDASPRRALAPFGLFGATAFFYYVIHLHLLVGFESIVRLNRQTHGLLTTWSATAIVLVVLAPACAWYRGYKRAHPDGWTRYL